jgi:tRNA (uracil-5-)-methyltransferase TRM9
MQEAIVQKLLAVNRQFYSDFAASFSATRQRLQPGVLRILGSLPLEGDILDLGCGNGELWQQLARQGFPGRYTGLDFSPGLLEIARQAASSILNGDPAACSHAVQPPLFLLADLASETWPQILPAIPQTFDLILAFAALHHLPGTPLRKRVLLNTRQFLPAGGCLVHSEWQFLNSARLRQRIQPWAEIGLQEANVDPGDYLLDWRSEGKGLRYVHHFEGTELSRLAEDCGFEIQDSFQSDGEGGHLSLYQVWKSTGSTV